MTLWDGGCKVTSRSSAFVEPAVEKPHEEIKLNAKKKFVSTRPRSVLQPQSKKHLKTPLEGSSFKIL